MKRRNVDPRPQCPYCGRTENQVRKGFNDSGTQRCKCKECGVFYTERPKGAKGPPYSAEIKEQAIKLYRSGLSSRQVGRTLGLGKNTVLDWIKEKPATKEQ